jgi:hypothetical protein
VAGSAPPAGGDEALGNIALAPAVDRGIDRQAERGISIGDRAADMIVDERLVAADVQLIKACGVGRGLRNLLEPRLANRAEHMGDAERRCGAHHRSGSARMEAFQSADRSQHDRQAQPAAEVIDGGIDPADIAQHARPERKRIERQAIAPERSLALGPADDVVPIVLVQILARFGDDLVQVQKFRRDRPVMHGGRLL